jgi:ABC-2 type transport system ATP-binding protein
MTGGWTRRFEDELLRLGVQAGRARQVAEETAQQATESATAPDALFGPAHLYARHLLTELNTGPHRTLHHPGTATTEPGAVRLRLTGVSKRYRRRTVFSDVYLTARAGEVTAVVGANGCGKSTLLRICAGLVRPSGGNVQRTRRVGYVPQDGGTAGWLTAGEHFTLFGAAAGLAARRARSTGEHLAGRLAWRPARDQLAQHLSGGTRQKLNLVLGELHAPDLLLLDEPYQGFDQGTYLDFWQQVHAWRDAGKAVVVVTHLLHDLQHVDHVYDLGAAA